jgi:hypothetical protein
MIDMLVDLFHQSQLYHRQQRKVFEAGNRVAHSLLNTLIGSRIVNINMFASFYIDKIDVDSTGYIDIVLLVTYK